MYNASGKIKSQTTWHAAPNNPKYLMVALAPSQAAVLPKAALPNGPAPMASVSKPVARPRSSSGTIEITIAICTVPKSEAKAPAKKRYQKAVINEAAPPPASSRSATVMPTQYMTPVCLGHHPINKKETINPPQKGPDASKPI
eukprot:TRINITY_DN56474_c0_g1_i1.p2 TRINITY_DN56474_c0_g1~~TRINITY_DN56474_c0_g1_i1.p2  ORF type:complete len:143 (+),score=9.94 TRINITY_DN56474_c0_g1_i1:78-506(+)